MRRTFVRIALVVALGTGVAAAEPRAAAIAEPAASAVAAADAITWLQALNAYRVAAGAPAVTEDPLWSDGISSHLKYLRLTPDQYFTGQYANIHKENPESPYYTAAGAAAGLASNLITEGVDTDEEAIDLWMAAPFHAIGMLRSKLVKSGFARDEVGAAGLDVLRGNTGSPSSSPILFPGPGSHVHLKRFLTGEVPDPLESCPGYAPPAGLPLLALLTTDPDPATTATLKDAAGTTLASCAVTRHNYFSSDPIYGQTGYDILNADHAVMIIPKAPLVDGVYSVTVKQPGKADIAWSFTEETPITSVVSVSDATITEGNSGTVNAVFTVSRTGSTLESASVTFSTANGSAVAPGDFTAVSKTAFIAIGQTSTTVTVKVNGDTTVEPDETFTANLTNPQPGVSILDGQGIGTIKNDDSGGGGPTLSVADLAVTEGNSGSKALTFKVKLSAAATSAVSVQAATADGTATAPTDYTAVTSTLTFQPGDISKNFTVTVKGDTVVEPNETLTVTLSNPSGATISDGTATGTITNDDGGGGPTLSIADASTAEGNRGTKTLVFRVTLSAPASSTVTVQATTANGTAVAPGDYAAASTTLTFAPGETAKNFSVVIAGDTAAEPNETFTVTLSNAAGATIGDGQAVGTITNDDTGAARAAV